MKKLRLEEICAWRDSVRAGDTLLLTGEIFTARDAAHKLMCEAISKGENLPFDIKGKCVYYAGPTGTPPGQIVGSIGPTTSSRMDKFTPTLLDLGLSAMIGKGARSQEVIDSMCKNHALYFCAVGGAGAYISSCVKSCEVIAYEHLGCESVKRLYVEDFLVFCGIDTNKNSIFNR